MMGRSDCGTLRFLRVLANKIHPPKYLIPQIVFCQYDIVLNYSFNQTLGSTQECFFLKIRLSRKYETVVLSSDKRAIQ